MIIKKHGKRKGRINAIFHVISVTVLIVSLLYSIFYFRGVFFRLLQSIKDFVLSVGYYFTELSGFAGLITPTVTEIPPNVQEILPFDPAIFQAKLSEVWTLLISTENMRSFLVGLGRTMSVASQVVLLLLPLVLLLFFVIKSGYHKHKNEYNADTKPLQIYKRIEAVTWEKVKRWVRAYISFLHKREGYIAIFCLIWVYNLNVLTIVMEGLAYFFYFSIAYDLWHIYTQISKLAFDLTVSIDFLPWYVWLTAGLLIFDVVRKRIGLSALRSYESHNRSFLTNYLGALFLVGKQRSKKTTIITDMSLTQELIYRDAAKEKLSARDKQFPFFPWINVELFYKISQKNHSLPTLASYRKFVRFLRKCFENSLSGVYDKTIQKGIRRYLKRKYGYKASDFLFGYDYKRYGLEYNDGLSVVNVFEAIENYIQLYYIYAAPTSLLFGNYAVRTDLKWEDYGNFPNFDGDFFKRAAKDVKRDSQYSHILDFDSLRLGKVFDENNPYKDGFEIGCVSITEMAKERGNQNTNVGIKADAIECNQKNDLFEINTKMQGHNSTIDNYTFFRLLLDDQRADSLSADNRDLCDIILIKGVKDAKIVMPGFAIEEAIYLIASKIYDKIYYKLRTLRGDNTLFIYMMKKLYSPIYNHFLRIYNMYSVYVAQLKVWDGMNDDQVLTDKGKYYISTKKTYSGRFATDSIKNYYNAKAIRSGKGLNDFKCYGDVHMTVDEMKQGNSIFYTRLNKIFLQEEKTETGKRYDGSVVRKR